MPNGAFCPSHLDFPLIHFKKYSTRNVLEACDKVKVKKIIAVSSTSVYGAHPDNPDLALDLYLKGVSLRKNSDHIKQFFGVSIGKSAIYKWLQKYEKIINEYSNQLEPELSETWNTDEMKIKCGGKWNKFFKKRGSASYFGTVITWKQRFLPQILDSGTSIVALGFTPAAIPSNHRQE